MRQAERIQGVRIGIVTQITDPDGPGGKDSKYRIKVWFPWLPSASSSGDQSYWARICVPMAGPDRGTYFLPEVNDQVLVAFEHGDIRRPIILGAVHSAPQPPPEGNCDGKNSIREIKSREGHRLIFDDALGKERVILVDKTKKNQIVFDVSKNEVHVSSAGDIVIEAPTGAVRVHGATLKAGSSGNVTIEAPDITIATKGALTCAASATLTLSGGLIKIN